MNFLVPTTPRDFAKLGANVAVALQVQQSTKQQVAQHTDLDPDSIPVKVGAFVAGQLVAWKTRPLTDKAVDALADRIVAFKNRKTITDATAE